MAHCLGKNTGEALPTQRWPATAVAALTQHCPLRLPHRLGLRSEMNIPLPVSLDVPEWESCKHGTETNLRCVLEALHPPFPVSQRTNPKTKARREEDSKLLPFSRGFCFCDLQCFYFSLKNNAVYETPQLLKSARGGCLASEAVMKDKILCRLSEVPDTQLSLG